MDGIFSDWLYFLLDEWAWRWAWTSNIDVYTVEPVYNGESKLASIDIQLCKCGPSTDQGNKGCWLLLLLHCERWISRWILWFVIDEHPITLCLFWHPRNIVCLFIYFFLFSLLFCVFIFPLSLSCSVLKGENMMLLFSLFVMFNWTEHQPCILRDRIPDRMVSE